MITIQGLQKSFGSLRVLEDISLAIPDGEIYGLVGASGAGKSTLLRCVNGLVPYDAGSLQVDGVEVGSLSHKQLRHLQKDIAMIFQNFSLMSRMTVYQNIGFPMKCWGYSRADIDRRVRELAERVGISDKLNVLPAALSGGQKQRVAIARALAMKPKILLSDEATSALDPATTQSILELLRAINEELGITIIVVTHQMEVVRSVCHSVSLLEQGRIIESGRVKELFFQQPDALRRFLGETPGEPPAAGALVQLLFADADSRRLVSRMGAELSLPFALVSGSTEKYRDEELSRMLLSFEEQHMPRVEQYLNDSGVRWRRWQPLAKQEGEDAVC